MAFWRELVFTVPAGQVDAWSDALLEAGALSVQAEDADADSPDEQAIFGEPGMPAPQAGWQRTRLRALLAEDAAPEALLREAADAIGAPLPADPAIDRFDDQDWVRASQAQFEPIPIGERLVITPTWHLEAPLADGATRLVLDPGLAFGTGSHPTTRMCLGWLSRELQAGTRVIDYGCGSGILAIAAALLGASEVVATDIDPQALSSTADNALANQVRVQVQATSAPLAPADVVLANILANPLKVLAPALVSLLRPGATLVLAGLLERQVEEVSACYPEVDLRVADCVDGWACLAGRRVR
ncbi:MAG: 50S ribosomal protein L11 methyltransferase [Betaproteobacteria bacterium]|nr:50S ribosomal protein L11 methyltransferase [Betaproteobacteria bacterium]